MAHAIYVKLQHWPCLASRLRPVKKLAPCFSKHARELPVIKSRNRKILDYIYIYRAPVVQGKSLLLPPPE